MKLFVSKEFAREVDYLHGVDHILSREDCNFLELVKMPAWETQTVGTGCYILIRSLENLATRIARLRGASDNRNEELIALNNLVEFNKGLLNQKMNGIMNATTTKFDVHCPSKPLSCSSIQANSNGQGTLLDSLGE